MCRERHLHVSIDTHKVHYRSCQRTHHRTCQKTCAARTTKHVKQKVRVSEYTLKRDVVISRLNNQRDHLFLSTNPPQDLPEDWRLSLHINMCVCKCVWVCLHAYVHVYTYMHTRGLARGLARGLVSCELAGKRPCWRYIAIRSERSRILRLSWSKFAKSQFESGGIELSCELTCLRMFACVFSNRILTGSIDDALIALKPPLLSPAVSEVQCLCQKRCMPIQKRPTKETDWLSWNLCFSGTCSRENSCMP